MLFPAGKDASEAVGTTAECFAYTQAAQLLDSVVVSIYSEQVNVENIETITRNQSNFDELVNCYCGQPTATIHVDPNYILERTQELTHKVAQFEEMRRSLLFLCRKCLTFCSHTCETRG